MTDIRTASVALLGKIMSHKLFIIAVALITSAVGCTTTRTSNTDRTGLEQLLISNAIDQALNANQFTSARGRNVFVDEKYLECTDKPYIVGSIRSRVLDAGGRLVDSVDHADVVMEVRSGGVGTDNTDKYIGSPGLAVPGLPFELPEVRLWEQNAQYGTAKIAISCFDTKTGQQIENSDVVARSDSSRWNVVGFTTGDTGSVHRELAQAVRPRGGSFGAPIENISNEVIAAKQRAFR